MARPGRYRRRDRASEDASPGLAQDYGLLDDPASSWEDLRGSWPPEDQYEDSIHTGLLDSTPPKPRLSGSRSSPWRAVRATFRSRRVVGRTVSDVVDPRTLFPRALACASRAVRREVLFALRRTGKGSGAKRRQRSFNSKWRC